STNSAPDFALANPLDEIEVLLPESPVDVPVRDELESAANSFAIVSPMLEQAPADDLDAQAGIVETLEYGLDGWVQTVDTEKDPSFAEAPAVEPVAAESEQQEHTESLDYLMEWSEAEMTGLGMPEVVLPELVVALPGSEPAVSLD